MATAIETSAALAAAYIRTRLLHSVLTSRDRITRWHSTRIEKLRRHAVSKTEFYGRIGDVPFADFPIVTKATVMNAFEAFNVRGLTASAAWKLIETGATLPGYDVGCSSGTSGNRGLYLVSERERFVWLGTIVAKAIPDVLRRRHRVAIILPRASRLYDAANEARLITLQFFDLGRGLDAVGRSITAFQPTIVVGPPKALRWMAEHGTAMKPERVFASAEVLDAPDRAAIEAEYGLRLGQIYMATEGLFAVTCAHGTIHLAEDAVHFEYEQVGAVPGLVTPIVTDFTRRTQVMARYRLNDLLRLDPSPCPCGSALQAVSEIVGRRDDCFVLSSRASDGPSITMTPDVLRNAVIGADRSIDDFRIYQTGARTIELVLTPAASNEAASAAQAALLDCCRRFGSEPHVTVRRETMEIDPVTKLRRVERRWTGAATDV